MKCPACHHDSEADALFCEECVRKMALACDNCSAELKLSAKFCPKCGTPAAPVTVPPTSLVVRRVADYTPKRLADKILQSKSALEGERKQVTVLSADIQG